RPEGTSGDSEGREGERNTIGAAGAETLENMRNSANLPKKKAEGVGFEPTLGTSPSQVFKTGADSPQGCAQQVDPSDADSVFASCLALLRPVFPELALVAEAWPTLPEAVRAGIVAMMRATGKLQ